MSWRSPLVIGGVLFVILLGLLAGLARGFGTDLGSVLDVWGRVIRSVLFWVIVAGAAVALAVAGAFLLRRWRTRTRGRTITTSTSVEAQPHTAGVPDAPAVIVPPPAPADHVPGPRDFVPAVSARVSDDDHAEGSSV